MYAKMELLRARRLVCPTVIWKQYCNVECIEAELIPSLVCQREVGHFLGRMFRCLGGRGHTDKEEQKLFAKLDRADLLLTAASLAKEGGPPPFSVTPLPLSCAVPPPWRWPPCWGPKLALPPADCPSSWRSSHLLALQLWSVRWAIQRWAYHLFLSVYWTITLSGVSEKSREKKKGEPTISDQTRLSIEERLFSQERWQTNGQIKQKKRVRLTAGRRRK
jgi:hypothetical protein